MAMLHRSDSQARSFIIRLLRPALPTLIMWLFTFDWITRGYSAAQSFIRFTFILLAALWLANRVRKGLVFELSTAGVFLILYTLYSILLIGESPLPYHSAEVALNNLPLLFMFFYFLNDVRTDEARRGWQFAFLQLAIIFSLFNLFLVFRWYQEWFRISEPNLMFPPFGYRLPGLFLQHPNIEAAFLNLFIPFLLMGFLTSRRRIQKYLLGSILLLLFSVSFFAGSRGAWLATASSVTLLLLLRYWGSLKSSWNAIIKKGGIKTHSRPLLIIGLGIAIVASFALLSYQQSRFGSHGGRLTLWQAALNVFLKSPVFGHGLGSFHILGAVEMGIPPGFYLVHAHNLLLQLLNEGGILGIVILSGFALTIAKRIRLRWVRDHQSRDSLVASCAVLLGMLTHGLFDFAFEAPLYTIVVLYIFAELSPTQAKHRSTGRFRTNSVPALIIILFTLGSLKQIQGAKEHFLGVQAGNQNDWKTGQALLCKAHELNDQFSFYTFQCALGTSIQAQIEQDNSLVNQAAALYHTALEVDPYWPLHLVSSAALDWEVGLQGRAFEKMLAANEQAPNSTIIALNLAWMYAEQGDTERGHDLLEAAFTLDPWLWRSASPRQVFGKLPALDIQFYGAPPSLLDAIHGWMLLESGDHDGASTAFELAIKENPTTVEAYAGLAKLALIQGDIAEVGRIIDLAEFTGRDSPILDEVRGEIADIEGDSSGAIDFWLSAVEQLFWTNSMAPYYRSVYMRAYLPIDLSPYARQPALPPVLQQGFKRALTEGSPAQQARARSLLPWYLNQVDLSAPE